MTDRNHYCVTVSGRNSWFKTGSSGVRSSVLFFLVTEGNLSVNYLDFFASVIASVTSLAWPAALVASVWIFRHEIRPLLPKLRLKHKDTEISFRLDEAERALEALPPPPADVPPATPEEINNFERLAQHSPQAALMEIRNEVEAALHDSALKSGWDVDGTKIGPKQLLRMLRQNNQINPVSASLFDDVISIGNAAAHGKAQNLTVEDALRYREIADRAIGIMNLPDFLSWAKQSSGTTQEGN
jgi:hypothetical protein